MSLRMVIGGAGSGKSTYLFDQILRRAKEEPKRHFIVIVPEQFTMSTQRELVARSSQKIIMNVDVLSFNRLAYRVFEETGTKLNDVLEDTGKNLLLRRVAQEHEKELTVLRGNVRRPGYIDEIKSLLTEMAQYGIGPKEFADLAELTDMGSSFRRKAEDLSVIYRAFREAIEGRYITAEEVLERLAQLMDQSALIKDAVIAIDGFTGFTPIQKQVLAQMMRLASSIYVTLTMDPGERITGSHLDYELFAMTKEMGEGLVRLAGENRCLIEEPVCLTGNPRFAYSPMLAHLEANLFRPKSRPYGKELPGLDGKETAGCSQADTKETASCAQSDAKENASRAQGESDPKMRQIRLGRAASFRDELAFAGEEIRKKIRDQGGRYRDFAIVCANLSDYADYAGQIFDKMDLPYYLDQEQDILFHPLVEFILSSLSLLTEDFSEESLMQQLRSGLAGIDPSDADLLERYIHARRIRGFARYRRPFSGRVRNFSQEQMLRVEQLRKGIVADISDFRQSMCAENAVTRDRALAIYAYLQAHEVEEKLEARANACRAEGDEIAASIHSRVFGLVMETLEKMSDLLGEEKMSLSDFAQLLEAGLRAISVGTVPPSFDSVVIGDLERTRLEHIKTLYVLGASDAAIPRSAESSGLFSQAEREKLREKQIDLAPGDRERAFMQRFYLYLALTKPSEQLVVSYARLSSDGSALRESYLIGLICRLFPGLGVENLEGRADLQRLVTAPAALDYLPDALRSLSEKEASREEGQLACAIYEVLKEDKNFTDRAEELFETAFSEQGQDRLSERLIKRVSGDLIQGSVSRLEQFCRCAYAYYLRYGLLLQEEEEPEIDFLDMGNLHHQTLEFFSKRMKERKLSWKEISDSDAEALLEEAFRNAVGQMERAELLENRRQAQVIRRMKSVLRCSIWALREQVTRGDFVPEEFEMSFGPRDQLSSMRFQLGEREKLQLSGKIDRVDCMRTPEGIYVKVMDYKSGNQKLDLTRLYHGLQIQLVLYMSAALEKLGRGEKKAHPAGLFYFHIDEPWIKSREGAGPEEIQEDILDELKLRGIYNREDLVVNALDENLAAEGAGASHVISARRNKDGKLSAGEDALSEEDIRLLGSFVHDKIEQIGRDILEGKIEKNPYKLGKENGCQYCAFRAVCGFEDGLKGMRFHRMANYKGSQALDLIREETKKEPGNETDKELPGLDEAAKDRS